MNSVTRFTYSTFQREINVVLTNWRAILRDSNKKVLGSTRSIHIANNEEMNGKEICVSLQSCASLLQQTIENCDVKGGRTLHSIFIKVGLDQNVFIQNNILKVYANCGDMTDARQVFDKTPQPNLVTWTSIISSYMQHGHAYVALELFSLMIRSGFYPNEFGFSSALKACRIAGELVMGKLVHGCVIKWGFEFYVFCGTNLLDMYVKCGIMDDARKFFEGTPVKCEASWNTLIDGYIRNSDSEEAMRLFRRMLHSDLSPSCFTYTILVKLWANLVDFDRGSLFHAQIVKTGFEIYDFVGSSLVDMYAKCGAIDEALRVFHSLVNRDNMVWSTLLAAFHQHGDAEEGHSLYVEFISEGMKLDQFTFAAVFNLCLDLEMLELGFQVHADFVKSGFLLDSYVGSALIDMYVNFGLSVDAHKIFHEVLDWNEMCYNAMISGFVLNSENRSAIELFSKMRKVGFLPIPSTLCYTLRAFSNLDMLEQGKVIHGHIMKTLGDSNLYVGNALIGMYVKCGRVDDASVVFEEMDVHNEFSWTTMITGYVELEKWEKSLELFHDMHALTSTKPSQFTLVVVLQACSKLEALDQGKQIHDYIIKSGIESNSFIGSTLIDMYAKSSSIQDAYCVFSKMSQQDVVSWSAMIAAYAQHKQCDKALKLFSQFHNGPIVADEFTFVSCLLACSSLVALDMGKQVHDSIIKTGFESNLHIGCSTIDMYCKCGSIEHARKFFNKMTERNVVSWTAMASGYAQHGCAEDALKLFDEMKEDGVPPDGATFISVLSACSHTGLVKEGWVYFKSMRNDYGLDQTINHYACMIDLLGRAGNLDEAESLISKAPFRSKTFLWRTLMGACSKHGNMEVGSRVAKILVELEPDDPSTYVLLSNIYASASMWDHSINVRSKMREGSLRKVPGQSWIEIAT